MRVNEYELPEDDTSVGTCSSVVIYKLIVTALLLVILQDKKIQKYEIKNKKTHPYILNVQLLGPISSQTVCCVAFIVIWTENFRMEQSLCMDFYIFFTARYTFTAVSIE